MKITACILVLVLVVECVLGVPFKQCPKNEQLPDSECGSGCEPSCRRPDPDICTMQCVTDCRCKPDFFRNDAGNCVTKEECPKIDLCAEYTCPKGKKCVLKQVQCFADSCDPVPACE